MVCSNAAQKPEADAANRANLLSKTAFENAVKAAAAASGVPLTVLPNVNTIYQAYVDGGVNYASSSLSSGAIIGIIVGVGVVLIILFVLVWYFAFNSGAKAGKAKAEFDDITVDASASAVSGTVSAPSAVSGQVSGDADLEVKLDIDGAETAVTSVEMTTVETSVDASAVVSVEMQSTVTMEVQESAVIDGAEVEVEVEATAVRTQI